MLLWRGNGLEAECRTLDTLRGELEAKVSPLDVTREMYKKCVESAQE